MNKNHLAQELLAKKAYMTDSMVPFTMALPLVATLMACGSDTMQTSQPKIVNGIVLSSEDLPEVVELNLTTTEGYQSLCTGTFVNDRQVLTAGHCVQGIRAAAVKAGGTTAYARAASIHPQYQTSGASSHDVAVLTFPANTSSVMRPIAKFSPRIGADIAIVGFGNTEVQSYIDVEYNPYYGTKSEGLKTFGNDGKKRLGWNTLDRKANGTLVFVGKMAASGTAGVDAAAAQGDSGGPMLAQGSDGTWAIVGVTSAGEANLDEKRVEQYRMPDNGVLVRQHLTSVDTVYVDLSSQSVRSYLARAITN